MPDGAPMPPPRFMLSPVSLMLPANVLRLPVVTMLVPPAVEGMPVIPRSAPALSGDRTCAAGAKAADDGSVFDSHANLIVGGGAAGAGQLDLAGAAGDGRSIERNPNKAATRGRIVIG